MKLWCTLVSEMANLFSRSPFTKEKMILKQGGGNHAPFLTDTQVFVTTQPTSPSAAEPGAPYQRSSFWYLQVIYQQNELL